MLSTPTLDRRRLLALGLGTLGAAALPARLSRAGGDPCHHAPRHVSLAGEDEPGERLRVEGLAFAPDGKSPAPGLIVYAYQTDAQGHYASAFGSKPRLRGFMRTDADGRFSYDTIRPGPYPGGRTAAHVHHQLWGGGYPPQWGNDLLFEGDPLVSAAERQRSDSLGEFGFVRPLAKDASGAWIAKIRLRLKTTPDVFEAATRHGLSACGLDGGVR